MSRKPALIAITTLLAVMMILMNLQTTPSRAASPTATPDADISVTVEFTGTIQSLTSDSLTLSDGNTFKITPHTKLPGNTLTVGMTITVSAEVDDEDFVADSITVGAPASDTSVGTPSPSGEGNGANGTNNNVQGGKGKGKGNNSNDDSQDQGNSQGGKGKGKGNGNGNSRGNSGNGNGKGKGKGENLTATAEVEDEGTAEATEAADNGDNGDHGKGDKGAKGGEDQGQNDKGKGPKGTLSADCLANDKQPVATQLAQLFGVSYSEIMKWHCQGYGFCEIARAYLLAQKGGKLTVQQIFSQRDSGQGWAQIAQAAGVSVNDLQSLGRLKGKVGKGNKQ